MSWISSFDTAERCIADYRVLPVDSSLRHWVRYYWLIKCGQQAPVAPEYLAPDGFEEIIFSYDSDFVRRSVSGDCRISTSNTGSYLVGCKQYGLVCTRTKALSMVGIKLVPGALAKILGISMAESGGGTIPLECLGSRFLRDLEGRVFEAGCPAQLKAVLDSALMRQLAFAPSFNAVDHAVSRLLREKGHCNIARLAEQTGLGIRQLQKLFNEQIGLTPKAIAGVVRFKYLFHTLRDAASGRSRPLLSEDFGYYDQAHLLKDFRRYTGTTPQRLFGMQAGLSTEMFDLCLQQDLTGDSAT